jgi:hypothetical protein
MLKKKKAIVQGFEMLVQLFYLADMGAKVVDNRSRWRINKEEGFSFEEIKSLFLQRKQNQQKT